MRYSIVIPVYNEEENLKNLHKRVMDVMKQINGDFELIFVNDGSHDSTPMLLHDLSSKDHTVKIINFSRNFGHQMAVSAGLRFVTGEMVAVIDADLQDPPEILPKFFEKLEEGYDTVYAIRKNRKEGFIMKLSYGLFYRILKMISDIDIPLDSGDFCVMRKRVVETINLLPERNRFIRGLRTWVGFKQTGLEYERSARFAGQSKYNLKKLFKLAFDGIFSFSYVPFQFMFYVGFLSLISSILGSGIVVYMRFFTNNYSQVPGFATTVILVIFVGGLQLFSMGLMGEYVKRIYDEIKQRPLYIIESTIGIKTLS